MKKIFVLINYITELQMDPRSVIKHEAGWSRQVPEYSIIEKALLLNPKH